MTADLSPAGPHSPEYTGQVADMLAECVRVLNYATAGDAPGLTYPADAYALLGTLAAGTGRLPQLFGQVRAFLAEQAAGGGLADDSGRDVMMLAAAASAGLIAASAHAESITRDLLAAQQSLSGLSAADAEPATVPNDTYGPLTAAELADLRAAAHKCLACGMLADVDPELHQSRYGHRPKYRDDSGRVLVWFAGQWAEKIDESGARP